MSGRRAFYRRADRDPGEAWAEEVLAPLRREHASCDVAPAVMARVAAARGRRPLPGILAQPRLVWTSCALLGAAAATFLVTMAVRLFRGGALGLPETPRLLAPCGRLAAHFADPVARTGARCVAAAAPVLHAAWIVLEAAAPVVRGAGLAAATAGALSIVVSLYVFARARHLTPPAGARSGILPHGGTR